MVHDDLIGSRFVADGPNRCGPPTSPNNPPAKARGIARRCSTATHDASWAGRSLITRAELVVDALQMARWNRQPVGAAVPSDRGNTGPGSSVTGYAEPGCSARWEVSPVPWTTR